MFFDTTPIHKPSLAVPASAAVAAAPVWPSAVAVALAGEGLAQGAGFDREITGAPLPLVLTVDDWIVPDETAEELEDAVAPHTLDAPLTTPLVGTKLTDTSFPLFSFSREGVFVGAGTDKLIEGFGATLFLNCAV